MTLQRKANDNKYLKIFSTSLATPELQIKSALRVPLLLDMMAITNKREGAERMYTPEGSGKSGKTLSSAHNIALHTSTYDSCYYERRPPLCRRSSPSKFQNGWGGVPGDSHPVLLMVAWGGRAILLGGLVVLIGLQGFLIII